MGGFLFNVDLDFFYKYYVNLYMSRVCLYVFGDLIIQPNIQDDPM